MALPARYYLSFTVKLLLKMSILLSLLGLLFYLAPSQAPCSLKTCRLPYCSCATKGPHILLPRQDIPQIVLFTFDDAVNERVFSYYQRLFTPSQKNPNGCPVSVTFFVSHDYTVYNNVRHLYLAGHEIGSHSETHRMPQSWWTHASYDDLKKEMAGQRLRLSREASIPLSEIRGLRMPFLEVGGDVQFRMMKDVGFEFDATFMTGLTYEGRSWPFTLDYPPWHFCRNSNCPTESHPGIWEIPLNEWKGIHGEECPMVDNCPQTTKSKADVLTYLWQNFNASYNGHREPFGLNMHAEWFQQSHRLEAMQTFISELLGIGDVYILTVSQAIEWMRSPQPVRDAKHFAPWKTSCWVKTIGRRLITTTPKPAKRSRNDFSLLFKEVMHRNVAVSMRTESRLIVFVVLIISYLLKNLLSR